MSGLHLRPHQFRRFIAGMLLTTFVLALLLRCIGLGFGQGVLAPRPDEELMQSGVLNSLRGDLNPHYAVWGHLFHYCYLAVATMWHGIGLCSGRFASWTEAVAWSHLDPTGLLVCGRALSAVIGALTVWCVYVLARESSGSRLCGLIAAAMLSTLFLHVRDSHFATSDLLLAATCTTSLSQFARPGAIRPGWAGFWCGLALATKLLAVTVLITFITCMVFNRHQRGKTTHRWANGRAIVRFLIVAIGVMLIVQPFLLLDPMETWYGWFGDLFNPERRPFQRGINLRNASIIVRYYIPQAMGWPVVALAIVGGVWLAIRHGRAISPCRPGLRKRVGLGRALWGLIQSPPLVFLAWSFAALLSVDRMFLRYLDPILPSICVLAAAGALAAGRILVRAVAAARGASNRSATRLAVSAALATGVVLPNVSRSILLDSRLVRRDTRALARDWIEQNVPLRHRILWLGYGQYKPHITMPWLHATTQLDDKLILNRSQRGLTTDIEETVRQIKVDRQLPTYTIVGVSIGSEQPEQDALVDYPILDHSYAIPLLQAIERITRRLGLVHSESTRWDLMQRHIASVWEATAESIELSGERYVVLTGMPCDPKLLDQLSKEYEVAQVIDPCVPWSELGASVMYDMGDAWYLPSYGIGRVDRPGPQICILRRRDAD